MSLPVYDESTSQKIKDEADKIECNRCGKCCTLPSGKDCRNLIRSKTGRSHCIIYARPNRVGSYIGEGQYCNNIMRVPVLFEGCPYNAVKERWGIVSKSAIEPLSK